MEYFKKFSSNTYAGSGNQLYFGTEENEIRTGRLFYKISFGGKYNYSVLFSNIIDENGKKEKERCDSLVHWPVKKLAN